MIASLNNIGIVCSKHSVPNPTLVEGLTAKDLIGWFVKLAFPLPQKPPDHKGMWPQTELMWVMVTGGEGNNCIGELNNEPLFADIKCGDRVEFSLGEVVQLLPPVK